jgi:hypothetical protein
MTTKVPPNEKVSLSTSFTILARPQITEEPENVETHRYKIHYQQRFATQDMVDGMLANGRIVTRINEAESSESEEDEPESEVKNPQ